MEKIIDLEKIITVSTGERFSYDTSKTWVDLFKENAAKIPDRTAVADEYSEMTYAGLDAASDKIAASLLLDGVREDEFVAIRMGRVKEFVAAVLGVHKAGAAYLPIDMDYPAGRVSYMLDDSEAKITLTTESVGRILAGKLRGDISLRGAAPGGLAYMIYTSGSTGKPKGVMVEHKAMLNFIHFIRNRWGITEKSRIACHSNFSFDASVEDLYPALTTGGTVFIVPEDARRDVFEMRKFISDHKINGGSYSTRFGQLLTDENHALDVDYICLGGEAMTSVPNVTGKIYNVYGPTEFTVDATYFELEKGREYNPIPIGRPIYNNAAYIVGKDSELLPLGEVGELCLAGAQLAAGYWKRRELTAEKFNFIDIGGEKIKVYHTGDLAKYDENGNLIFCGRMDFQVKLRGFRIELGEIENIAAKYSGLTEVAAEVKNDTLCLYYTAGGKIDEDALKDFLSESLADYMVPSIYMRLDKMPMTPNGKLDKKALPSPRFNRSAVYVKPRTMEEEAVAGCMEEALGDGVKAGAMDDFFALGGDSIKAIYMIGLLREKGLFVKVSDVFEMRTVEKIALAASGGPEIEVNAAPFAGQVEDTAIFNFYKDLDLPEKNYYNQSTLLILKPGIDRTKLQDAFDRLTFQHDMLRAVIRDEHLFVKEAQWQILVEEYSIGKDTREGVRELCTGIESHLSPEEALVRAALIHAGGKDLFFVTAHHTVIDGISWRILLSDLEKALGGEELPGKTNTYNDYALAMKEYRNSSLLAREIPYWQSVEKKMLSLETSGGKDYSRRFAILDVALDEDSTGKVFGADLSVYGLEINDLLLAAVGESYRRIFGKNAVSVQMEGHGREYIGRELLTDRTIGWFTSIYPVVLEDISGDAKKDLIAVKENLRRIPNKGVGYNILAFVDGEKPLNFEKDLVPKITFNYLGNVSGERVEGRFFTPGVEYGYSSGIDYQSDQNRDGSDLAINCLIDEGKLHLWLGFNLGFISGKTAEAFANGILSEAKRLAEHLSRAEKTVTPSDLGENEWTQEEFEAVWQDFAARGEQITRIYPLTPMQEAMLFAHESDPESPAYRLVDIYELSFLPTKRELRCAIDALAEKYEVLRTAIIHKGVSRYRQAITGRRLSLSMEDLSAGSDPLNEAKKIRQQILAEGFDLQEKPLMQFVCAKISDERCYLIIAVHHIIVDGWCVDLYLEDFERFLKTAHAGGEIRCDHAQNGAYERAVREIVAKNRGDANDYFCKVLARYENKAEIPSYGEVPQEERYFDTQITSAIAPAALSKLEKACRKAGATLANGIELAWGLVINTLCRTEDAVFGKVVSGRGNLSFDVSDTVGLFINTVPVRVKIEPGASAADLLGDLRRQAAEGAEYDYCPLSEIQKAVGMTDGFIYSIISIENYTGTGKQDSVLKPVLYREEIFGGINLDLSMQQGGGATALFTFDPAHYREAEIRRMISLFENFIGRIAQSPESPVASLPLLSAADEKKIIDLSKGEEFAYDSSKTWVDLFRENASKTPGNIAAGDETSEMTYAELDAASDKIAAALLLNGVGENEFVAVRMGRTKEFLAAVLGIHKIGAAYVPIDLNYPEDRVNYMMEDSGAAITLTDESVAGILGSGICTEIRLRAPKPDNLAYMIYTSGSTGKPKGVMIRHKSLLSFIHCIRDRFGITEKSRIACYVNFAFDASIESLYPALTTGGAVMIVPEEARRDVFEMRRFIADRKISGGSFSTRFGQLLTDEDHALDLDYIVLGGEAMTVVPNITGRVFNAYGPTEFTVSATYFEVVKGREYDPIPIGRPVYNSAAYIVDRNDHLLPGGVRGELCLSGTQLAAGYNKRPDLTAEKFNYIDVGGKKTKVYHTGDLARYDENGNLIFCGRIDFQVKLRGFRIELGEIENRAEKFPGLIHAVADVKKNTLCLYYTADGMIDENSLREFLAEILADYMVPSIYVRLDEMPMTPSGKIDRKRLPAPDISLRRTEYEPPQTEMEQKLCDVFAEVLELDQNTVGRNDDFFDMGGDSLKTIIVMTRSGMNGLGVKDIFRYRTARRIAEALSARNAEDIDRFEAEARQKAIPATPVQIDMIDYQFLNVYSVMHNLGGFYRFDAQLDGERLVFAVNKVLRQHPALSSVFDFDGEEGIIEHIEPSVLPEVTIEEITPDEVETLTRTLLKPFSLFRQPLCRARIFKCGETFYLFIDMHHTISDGTSMGILLEDISKAYHGQELGKDYYYSFLLKQYEKRVSDEYKAAENYFQNLIEGKKWCCYPTPDFDTFDSHYGEMSLTPGITTDELAAVEKRLGFSRSILSVTAAILALRDYCGETAIRVDFLNSNRTEQYYQDTVGLMFKYLPVAIELENVSSIDKLLSEVNRQVAESFVHSICDYNPEGEVAMRDALAVNYVADMGDVSLLEGFMATEIPLSSEERAAGCHADVYLMESDGELEICVEYQKEAYKPGSLERFLDIFAGHLKALTGTEQKV